LGLVERGQNVISVILQISPYSKQINSSLIYDINSLLFKTVL